MADVEGYCGLCCQTCPIHLATRQADREEQTRMRLEILRVCKEQYGMDYSLAYITDCDGCNTVGGRLFSACSACPIRQCASEKKVASCAFCPEYACGTLEAFFKTDPGAKMRLEEIRDNRAD